MAAEALSRGPEFALGNFSLSVRRCKQGWLDATATFTSNHSTVTVETALHLNIDDVTSALGELERLDSTLNGTAIFESSEPGFKLTLTARERGNIDFDLEMEPAIDESYRYHGRMDQSYLPSAISGLRRVVAMHAHRMCD